MNTNARTSASPATIKSMFRHIPVLRTYARRAILLEEGLSIEDDLDREARVREYMDTGKSLNWNDKEMVVLLLREVFTGY